MSTKTTIKLTLETLGAFVEGREKQKAAVALRNRNRCEAHLTEEQTTLKADQQVLQDFFQDGLWKKFVEHLLPARNLIYICHSRVGRGGGESYWVDGNGNLHLVWGDSSYPIWDTRKGWDIVVSILEGTAEVIGRIKEGMQNLFNQEQGKIYI